MPCVAAADETELDVTAEQVWPENLCHMLIETGEWTATGYREVTDISVARPPVRGLATTTRGWRDLGVMVGGGGIVRGYEARLRYDGHSYPDNPTVSPAVRLQAIAGKQIIGEDAGQMTDTSSTAIKNGTAVSGVEEVGLDGSIGPYGVGAHMTVRDHTEFVAGHYFYARNPVDKGLTGGMDGGSSCLAR